MRATALTSGACVRLRARRSDALIDRKKIRFMGQNAKYAYVAMARAIEDSGLDPEVYETNPRVGGILGQADTSAENIEDVCNVVKAGKSIRAKIGPYRVTRTMSNSVSAGALLSRRCRAARSGGRAGSRGIAR